MGCNGYLHGGNGIAPYGREAQLAAHLEAIQTASSLLVSAFEAAKEADADPLMSRVKVTEMLISGAVARQRGILVDDKCADCMRVLLAAIVTRIAVGVEAASRDETVINLRRELLEMAAEERTSSGSAGGPSDPFDDGDQVHP